MTVVVGVNTAFDAFVVADCRVQFQNTERKVYRDFCQKIIIVNRWCVIGIAGDLKLARYLAMGITRRIRSEPDQQDWLMDNDRLMSFIESGVFRFKEKEDTMTSGAAVLIVWMDYRRMSPDGEWASGPPAPDFRMASIRCELSSLSLRRTGRGVDVIGRSYQFANELYTNEFQELITYFGRYSDDHDVGEAHRALIATEAIRESLERFGRMEGVGGLYQIVTLNPRGIRPIPYFYLADVEPGFKTYVAMRLQDGEWVQEHRPSKTVVRVKSPLDIDPEHWKNRPESVFDPSRRLTRTSPGVIPAKQIETVFVLYLPPDVPEAVRPSWGDAPLAPLTYTADWSF